MEVTNKPEKTFDQWLAELNALIDKFPPDSDGNTLRGLYGPKLDEEAFQQYFDENYSPEETLQMELSYL